MNRIFIAVTLFEFSILSFADSVDTTVRYECDIENDFIAIHYERDYSAPGSSNSVEHGINPWNLIEVDASGNRIVKMNTIKRSCKLSDGTYNIEIGPSPGNGNIQGRCGAYMTAWATLYKDGELLARTGFGGVCHDFESPVTTKLLWRAGSTSPDITEVPKDDFY